MGQIGEIIGFGIGLQARTIVELLRDRMEGLDRAESRRPSLKERLGLKGFTACCGATWRFGMGPTSAISVIDGDGDGDGVDSFSPRIEEISAVNPGPPSPPCVGMNLAAAMAAERQLRAALESSEVGGGRISERGRSPVGTPGRVSLMRLLEETNGYDGEYSSISGCDSVCCVCMGRKKGAAFIPCGHTFCRVCSRELWLNRGCCPLCNRPILEILDIY